MSLGCWGCWVDTWGGTFAFSGRYNTEAQFAHRDQLAMTMIQLAAKALEIWFLVPVTSLVYLLVVKQAASPLGIPFGWLSVHEGFPKLSNLYAKSIWAPLQTTGERRWGHSILSRYRERLREQHLWLPFSFLVLTALANVVGPSIAVLSIPKLSWVERGAQVGPRFLYHDYSKVPQRVPGCDVDELMNRSYNCSRFQIDSVDQFVENHAFFHNGLSTDESPSESSAMSGQLA